MNPGDAGEVIGLDQSIAYAQHLAEQAGAHGPDGNEGYLTRLAVWRVTGAGLATAHTMQDAFAAAATAAAAHAGELTRQKRVQEQYDLNPDAGDKTYATGNAGDGTPTPAPGPDTDDFGKDAMTTSRGPTPACGDGSELPDTAGITDARHWHASYVVAAGDGSGQVCLGVCKYPDSGAYVVVATKPAGQPWQPDSTANGIDPPLSPQEAEQLADALDELVALAESGAAAPAPTTLATVVERVRELLGDNSGVTIIGDDGQIDICAADIRTLLDAAAPEPAAPTRHTVTGKACDQDGFDTGTVWAQLDTTGPQPVIAITSTEGKERPEDYPEGYTTTRLSLAETRELAGTVRRFAQNAPTADAADRPHAVAEQLQEPPAARNPAAPAQARRVTNSRGRTYEYDPDTGATAVIEPDGWRAVVPPTSTTGLAARLLYWRAEIKDGRGQGATVQTGRELLAGLSAAELRDLADDVGAPTYGARTKPQMVDAIVNITIGAPLKHRGLSKW